MLRTLGGQALLPMEETQVSVTSGLAPRGAENALVAGLPLWPRPQPRPLNWSFTCEFLKKKNLGSNCYIILSLFLGIKKN